MNYDEYNDLFRCHGVPITLEHPDDFLKIRETLTRIGMTKRDEKTLVQSCNVLHKRGYYAICHFKELFDLDGKPTTIDTNDIARRNRIAALLDEWGLCKVVFPDKYNEPMAEMTQIKIIRSSEKSEWTLESKYTIGK
jgi:hypothetical protein